ncbi:alpha/beta-hydrolase [Echria macrotheca]|uniref:Alpha/beta-hydrolase n=1 Tax=Echria macrotheca TaxID=438768 RepID=A0AAJ0BJI8_9PEZI|nr:alpha/beta-hydrolase [Echria macrotheca]
MADLPVPPCCLKAFQWDGTPTGTEGYLPGSPNKTYITGTNPNVAVFVIHDLLAWTFPNIRLLADHYAREIDATVYVPDFFGGETLPIDLVLAARWAELDLHGFIGRNSREIREPEIIGFARALRAANYDKVGAIGFCYGGWAVHRLGAREFLDPDTGKSSLVDCVTAGHPSLLTKKDIDEVAVPVQILAPEIDAAYTDEFKLHSFVTMQKNGVPFNYVHFPKVEHACFVRGDLNIKGEREALVRGKNEAVSWARLWLHGPEKN